MNLMTFKEFNRPVRESSFRVNISYRNRVILNLLHQHHQTDEEKVLQRIVEFMACTLSASDDEGSQIIFTEVAGEGSIMISVPIPILSRLILFLDNNPEYQGKTASEQVSSILHNVLTCIGESYFELRDLDLTKSEIFNNIASDLDGLCGCNWM